MRGLQIFAVFLGLFLLSRAVLAEPVSPSSNLSEPSAQSQSKLFGIAMHGTPKYDPQSTHLDYVNPDAPKGGSIKQSTIGTFDTLNPYSIKGKAAQGLNLVYDRLMARVWDEPFSMYPLIAQSYEMPDDRSSITFHINPKARFHDGSAITAEDVLFSFETLKAEGRPNMRSVYKLVSKAEILAPLTIRFSFGEGYDKETALIMAMMPVLSKKWWSGRTFDSTVLELPNLNGPYTITAVDPGRSITFSLKPDYWAKDLLVNKGHYNFQRITYDYFRDDTVAFESFKSGNTDIRREFDIGKWSSGYDFPALSNGSVIKDAIAHQRPERVTSFIFNTRRAPFNDIRVREALNLLFDFEWANKNLYYGQYSRISSFFPNSELAARNAPQGAELDILEPWRGKVPDSVFGMAYQPPSSASQREIRDNMRKADMLLRAAGWNVVNGKRMKNGQPFTFEILLGAAEEEKLALHFKRSLEKMGITARIRVLDAAAYRGRMNVYDFDMTLYYWLSSLSPGTEQILYWGCAAAKEQARWNYPGICNPAIDHIAAQVARTSDRESLVAHMHALDRILSAGRYTVPLYYSGNDYFAYNAKIKRPDVTPIYGAVLETWWMDNP